MRHRDKKAAEEAMLGSAQVMPAPLSNVAPTISPNLKVALLALTEAAIVSWRTHRLPSEAEAETEVEVTLRVTVQSNGKAFERLFGSSWRKTADQPPADHQPVGEVRRG
jgi:hypothetical protein